MLEKHHRVQLLDEAIESAVKLSHRYIPARQLPDKAVSLLDTACARVAVSQHAMPAEVEDCRRRIESLEIEIGIIDREAAVGVDDRRRAAARSTEKLGAASASAWSGSKHAGRTRRRSSTRCSRCARTLRGDDKPVDGAAIGEGGDVPADRAGGRAIDREGARRVARRQGKLDRAAGR